MSPTRGEPVKTVWCCRNDLSSESRRLDTEAAGLAAVRAIDWEGEASLLGRLSCGIRPKS